MAEAVDHGNASYNHAKAQNEQDNVLFIPTVEVNHGEKCWIAYKELLYPGPHRQQPFKRFSYFNLRREGGYAYILPASPQVNV